MDNPASSERSPALLTGKRGIILSLVVLLLLRGIISAAAGQERHDFYYFNPDSPQNNLGLLKKEVDILFFKENYPLSFQPFAHLIDFERTIEKKRPAFVLVPDWYLRKFGASLGIQPILQPVRKGETTYHKVLLAAKKSGITPANLARRSLAMTTLGPDTEKILNRFLFADSATDAADLNIIFVPKDTDALFALVLGQVDMALVGRENINRISGVNPAILKIVTPVLESTPMPLPSLCFRDGEVTEEEIRRFTNIFLDADKKKARSKIMEMLQIDAWRKISD